MFGSFSRLAGSAAAAAGFILSAVPALGADPSSGTISASSPELTYRFPASLANSSGLVETNYTCDELNPCDEFALTVSLPADYATTHPNDRIRVAAATDNQFDDIDLQIADRDGNVLYNKRDNPPDQPTITFAPAGGTEEFIVQVTPGTAHGGGSVTITLYTEDNPIAAGCAPSGESNGGNARRSPGLAADLATLPPTAIYGAFVHFSKGTPAEHRALLESRGLSITADFHRYASAVFARGPVSGFRALVSDPSVTYLEQNRRLRYLGETASWATRARVAQESAAGGPYTDAGGNVLDGASVTIVIVDSGVNAPHPDFEGRVVHNYKIVGDDITGAAVIEDVGSGASSDTTGGHGTHVAGIALGSGAASTGDYPVPDAAPNVEGTFTGVAPGASLVAYGAGETLVILTSTIAFQHILDHYDEVAPRIRIISNSYGADGGLAYDPNDAFSCLTKALVDKGVSVVFAASNDGGDGSADLTSPTCKDPTPGVVCVANYNDNGTGALNNALDSSSSRGKKGDPANYPDIAAPGADYTATCSQAEPGQGVCASGAETRWQPWYGTISGTSMATPHVSGSLALIYQARPDLTPAQAEDLIQDTARKVTFNGAYDADPQNPGGTINFGVGAGLLNVQAALDALGASHGTLPAAGAETTIFDGDADASLGGAEDVVKLTMQESTSGLAGITYRLTVRDAADGAATYSLHQNVSGNPFVTQIEATAEGVTVPAAGPDNTAAASSVSRSGNVITFFVPYSQLGYPPVGAPIHNIRALSDTDFAPSPSAPATDASLEPMFGRPFTVQADAGAPPPLDPCSLPGVKVVTDATGDATNQQPAYDIKSIHVAEPGDLDGKIAFTMTVGSLATLPANTLWAVRFNTPAPPENGDEAWFVGLSTVGGTARFVYGTSYVESAPGASVTFYEIAGEIDQQHSGYTPEGVITMVADRSIFAMGPGDLLNNFIGTTRPVTQDSGPIAGGSQDTAEGGFYVLREGGACPAGPRGDIPSGSGVFVGGSLGLGSLALLGAFAALRRRRRGT
jgi:serine protease AprX